MNEIVPTVGRKVWFWPAFTTGQDQPNDATVAYVHKDKDQDGNFVINIGYRDMYGNTASAQGISLFQGDPADRPDENFCEWMPYQVKQAEKEVPKEGAVAQAQSLSTSDKIAELLKK